MGQLNRQGAEISMIYKSSQINSLKYKLVSKENLVFLYDSSFIKKLILRYENSFLPIGIPPFKTFLLTENICKDNDYEKGYSVENIDSIICNYFKNKMPYEVPGFLLVRELEKFFYDKKIPGKNFLKKLSEKYRILLSDLSKSPTNMGLFLILYSKSNLSLLSDYIKFPIQDILKEDLKFHDSELLPLLFYQRIVSWGSFFNYVYLILSIAYLSLVSIFILYRPIKDILVNLYKLSFNSIIFISIPMVIILIYILVFPQTLNFLILRIFTNYMNKRWVESLCIRELIYLLFDLSRDDANHRIDIRKILSYRIEYIAKLTLLIPEQYQTKNQEHKDWIKQHFENIYAYIMERGRWILAPTETTLSYLRDDFYKLTYVYLTGSYGDFQWQPTLIKTQGDIPLNFRGKLSKYLLIITNYSRFLIPLLLMIAYLSKWQNLIPYNESYARIVNYIFWAWLLVTLDITLKLGILESFMKIVKLIRDLAK